MGGELVDGLCGSAQAKQRLRAVLDVAAGRRTVEEACCGLGIGRSRFHALRRDLLQQALKVLEPKPPGRPIRRTTWQDDRVEALHQEAQALKAELRASQVREELALILPRVTVSPEPRTGRRGKKEQPRRRGRSASLPKAS